MDIIPFEAKNLPAYLANVDVAKLNEELTSHAGGGFPIISIKGKVFAVVRDGERHILTKEVDGEKIPAPSIDMVILKANKGTSKVWYAKGYTEGGENVKPDCFSNDGVKPDAAVENPCSTLCSTCKNNQWGSKIGDSGATKGKACSDSVRIAVATPDQINDPYLLRVPPASIRALGEFGASIKKRGVVFPMVVTRIGFDMEAPTPKLTFRAIGLVDDHTFHEVQEMRESDTVANILGQGGAASFTPAEPVAEVEAAPAKAAAKVAVSKDKNVSDEEVAAAVAQADRAAAPEKKSAKKTPEVEVSLGEIDLDDLSFDDL